MSTVTLARSNVTVGEVGAILARTLGRQYNVTLPTSATDSRKGDPDDQATIQISSSWFARASLRIAHDTNGTNIHLTPGAAYGVVGILLGFGLVRKVTRALEHAPELAGSE